MKLKNRIFTKNTILSIGGLALIVGMPISLVVACASPVTETEPVVIIKVASNIENINDIKPNESGVFTEKFDGWDLIAVSENSVGKADTPQLTNLSPGDKYLLQFTLKEGYSVPSTIVEIEIDAANEGTYYSGTFTFIGPAQELVKAEIDALYASDDALISETYNGWKIEVVNPTYSAITELIPSQEYKLKFTLLDSYVVTGTINIDFLISEDSAYYTTKTYTFTNFAEQINESKLSSILPTETGEISQTFTGWDITIVPTIDSIVELDSLSLRDTYFLRFTLQAGYFAPIVVDGLTLSDSELYYSSTQNTFGFEAADLSNLDNILSDSSGNIADTFTGWDVIVVGSPASSTPLMSLDSGDSYFLRFTLQAEFYADSQITGLVLDNDGSYYSSTAIIFGSEAATLSNLDTIMPDSTANISETFTGWDVLVVDSMDFSVFLTSLNPGDSYTLKFTLQAGFYSSSEIAGLTLNDDDSYYSNAEIIFGNEAAALINLDTIIPDSTTNISETFTGWDVSVVDSTDFSVSLTSLVPGDSYSLKFTLQSSFYINGEIDGLTLNDDISYYSTTELIFGNEAASLINLDTINPDSSGNISDTFTGWDVIAVESIGSSTPLDSFTLGTSYYLRFTLLDGFYASNDIDGLTLNADASYYSSDVINYVIEADTPSDLANVIPDTNGNISTTFTGWDVIVVSTPTSSVPLSSLGAATTYYLKFTLQTGYFAPSEITGLTIGSEDSYYSNSRITYMVEAAGLSNWELFTPDSSANVSKVATGWNITLVSFKDSNSRLTSLAPGSGYYLKFALRTGYFAPSETTNYLELRNGSYFSHTTIKYEIAAANLTNISSITSNASGNPSGSFTGWDLTIVGSKGSTTRLTSLGAATTYYLRFVLQNGYFAPSVLSGVSLHANGSYYSNSSTLFKVAAANVNNLNDFRTNGSGIVSPSLTGWIIDVVNPSSLTLPLTSLSPFGQPYQFRFRLRTGYFAPNTLNGLTRNSNGAYYSSTRTYPN